MDHSDSERGNPLPPHGLLFLISSNGYFIPKDEKQFIINDSLFLKTLLMEIMGIQKEKEQLKIFKKPHYVNKTRKWKNLKMRLIQNY